MTAIEIVPPMSRSRGTSARQVNRRTTAFRDGSQRLVRLGLFRKAAALRVAAKPRIMSSRSTCGAITVAEHKMHEPSKFGLAHNAEAGKEIALFIRCFLHEARYKAAVALAMMVLLVLESVS